MGRTEELSDFEHGTVIESHLCQKSVCELSALLDLPWSTVRAIIMKGTLGPITAQPQRDHADSECGSQVLKHAVCKSHLSSVATLPK